MVHSVYLYHASHALFHAVEIPGVPSTGLSDGAIAGIVVGVVVAITIVSVIVIILMVTMYSHGKKPEPKATREE